MSRWLGLRERVESAGLAEQAGFLLLVVATGAGMGLVAVGFRELLHGANQLFFGSFKGVDLAATLLDRP
ncbi:MAG TPA: hypothetical protein VKV26_00385 [Dehalococcoidia bacterium]|nr:hypothetical protein [Dehalococcoidia bacterium]